MGNYQRKFKEIKKSQLRMKFAKPPGFLFFFSNSHRYCTCSYFKKQIILFSRVNKISGEWIPLSGGRGTKMMTTTTKVRRILKSGWFVNKLRR
jgi:hypothetical protein